MNAAATHANYQHINCFAHTLQLAVKDALSLQSVDKLIVIARKVSAFFHRSVLAMQSLEEHQSRLGKKIQRPITDVITRWNSAFFMLSRLLEIRSDIYAVLHNPLASSAIGRKNLIELKDDQWTLAQQLVDTLKPLVSATEVLCSEEYATCIAVYPLTFGLLQNHLKVKDLDSAFVINIKEKIANGLRQRIMQNQYWLNPQMMCSVLDPKYKKLKCLSSEQQEQVYKLVDDQVKMSTGNNDTLTDPETVIVKQEPDSDAESESCPTKKSKADVFTYLMGDIIDVSDDETGQSDTEFQYYLADNSKEAGTFDWWNKHQSKYPRLAKLVRRYLCIPATSVSSERAFSTAGLTITKLRANLDSSTVDEIIFLNKNTKKSSVAVVSETTVLNIKVEPTTSTPEILSNLNSNKEVLPALPALPQLPQLCGEHSDDDTE